MASVKKLENALWGLFIGDALGMPVHFYDDPSNIRRDFGDCGIRTFEDAKQPHPERSIAGTRYNPDVGRAEELGRQVDILGAHARHYDTTLSGGSVGPDAAPNPPTGDQAKPEARQARGGDSQSANVHCHAGMLKGENTVAAELVRVLMRSVVENKGKYDPDIFIQAFVEFMTTPPKDVHRDLALRRWFENYSRGADPLAECAATADEWDAKNGEGDVATTSALLQPLVLALLSASSSRFALSTAAAHQKMFQQSTAVSSILSEAVPLLLRLIHGESATTVFKDAAAARGHSGDASVMWTSLLTETSTGSAVADGFSLALALAATNNFDLEASLLANANMGGDTAPRGALLGLLLGAAASSGEEDDGDDDAVSKDLKSGLAQYPALRREIEGYVKIAAANLDRHEVHSSG